MSTEFGTPASKCSAKNSSSVRHASVDYAAGGIQRLPHADVERMFQLSVHRVIDFGNTSVTRSEFDAFLSSIAPQFTVDSYDLLNWNCNHFSDAVVHHLVNDHLPAEILNQHQILSTTPQGQGILRMIEVRRLLAS